jgi:dihydroceramidase
MVGGISSQVRFFFETPDFCCYLSVVTGIGAYVGMALVEYLVTMDDGQNLTIEKEFVWPVADDLRDVDAMEKREAKKGQ